MDQTPPQRRAAQVAWLYRLSEREVRLEPKTVGREKPPPRATVKDLKAAIRFVKKNAKRTKKQAERPEWKQRCAVRVNYAKDGTTGMWYAVGRYITRESANDSQAAFNDVRDDIDMPNEMAHWRLQQDGLFFKVILSPEFGSQLDLKQLTIEVMHQVEAQKGKLEWMAVQHHNTDNPHVHVVIRGKDWRGMPLRFDREFVQNGFRGIAEEIVTRELGARTETHIRTAQERETTQTRFTGLDRRLKQQADSNGDVTIPPPTRKEMASLQGAAVFHMRLRLRRLESMGLARKTGKDSWHLDDTLEESLRTVQKTVDRQKMMAWHGQMVSDPKLPFRKLSFREVQEVEGRILVHGSEEQGNGIRNYMLLESITGEVLQVPHVREADRARHYGELQPGTYIQIKKTSDDPPRFEVQQFGAADALLKDGEWLRRNADRLARVMPAGYAGWFGSLHSAAQQEARPAAARNSGLGR